MVRILIGHTWELLRLGLIAEIERHADWQVAGEASTARQAIELAESLQPDLAAIGLSLDTSGGLSLLQHLQLACPAIRIVVVSEHMQSSLIRKVRRTGAGAMIGSKEPLKNVIAAVENVLAGQPFTYPESPLAPRQTQFGRMPVQYVLSERQIEVLRLLANGCSNKEIASILGLSGRTAECHVASIFKRLGTRSRGEVIRLAILDEVV